MTWLLEGLSLFTISGGAGLQVWKADSGSELAAPPYCPPDFREVGISVADSWLNLVQHVGWNLWKNNHFV